MFDVVVDAVDVVDDCAAGMSGREKYRVNVDMSRLFFYKWEMERASERRARTAAATQRAREAGVE